MSRIADYKFDTSVIGTDPITKGTFSIEWAYNYYNEDKEQEDPSLCYGYFKILEKDNPLFLLAKESPLRLQGLLASVNFGLEKRLIKIIQISKFESTENFIDLLSVKFELLDNLQYLENLEDYSNNNLL